MKIEVLLDELRVLAGNGLRYADDPWEEERWERVFDLVCEYTVGQKPVYLVFHSIDCRQWIL